MEEVPYSFQLAVEKRVLEKKAKISFVLPYAAHVLLRVFNDEDEEVRLLLNEKINEGEYTIMFNFNQLPSASYTVRLVAETDKAIDKETQTIQL